MPSFRESLAYSLNPALRVFAKHQHRTIPQSLTVPQPIHLRDDIAFTDSPQLSNRAELSPVALLLVLLISVSWLFRNGGYGQGHDRVSSNKAESNLEKVSTKSFSIDCRSLVKEEDLSLEETQGMPALRRSPSLDSTSNDERGATSATANSPPFKFERRFIPIENDFEEEESIAISIEEEMVEQSLIHVEEEEESIVISVEEGMVEQNPIFISNNLKDEESTAASSKEGMDVTLFEDIAQSPEKEPLPVCFAPELLHFFKSTSQSFRKHNVVTFTAEM